ncbi:MAG: T9SS type A sorting domain-containing protein [Bacteroidales bacterium]|jgi:hypothetical protein|nr:T9SS type A sorting domain-containing protein [Bacteroidales bacterium]
MKKIIKLIAALAIIASTIPLKGEDRIAVTYDNPYTENFDEYANNTLPTGWVNTVVNGTAGWVVYSGVLRKQAATPINVVTARVTTPAFDLSAVSNGRVFIKFNHRETTATGGVIEILRIYYKKGTDGELVKLDSFQNGARTNQEAVIELPNEAKVSNLYIVFEEYSYGASTIYVDDLFIYARPVYENNAEVITIVSPSSILENPSEETSVTAKVSNFGTNTITNINLTLEVDGTILATESVDDWNLSADGITDYTFDTKADLSAGRVAGGAHKIRVWVDLTDDENRGDDTVELSLIVCGDTVVVTPESPYIEDFNKSLTLLPCWTSTVVNGSVAFALSSSVLSYFNSSGANGQSAYVTTPVLDLSKVTSSYKVFVAFDHQEITPSDNTDIPNILTVYYKTGDNNSVKLGEFQNTLGSSNPYEHTIIELPEGAKVSNLTLIFEAVRQGSQAVYVDNVTVYCAEPKPFVPVAVTLESPYTESFDGLSGMVLPAGWENHITAGNKRWRTQDDVLCITNKGTASANYAEKSYVTSSLDLSALAPYKVALEFDHKESLYMTGNGIDKLVVYYKIGDEGELVKLDSFQNGLTSSSSTAFQHTIITLPNEAKVSNLYLAFEMQSNHSGRDAGIRIDNVKVYGIAPTPVTFESPYTENFNGLQNNALPDGWENHIVTGNQVWKTNNNELYIPLGNADYAEISRVTVPALDLTAVASPLYKVIVEFDHAEEGIEEDEGKIKSEKLVIYYKTGENGNLIKLDSFQNCSEELVHAVIELPIEAKTSNNIIFVFEEQTNDASGIRIDNFAVRAIELYLTDLRVLDYVDLPETDTLTDGSSEITVKLSIRNDSVETGSGNVKFHYTVTDESKEQVKEVSETYGSVIAESEELTYTFTESAVLTLAGSYTVKAWASFVNMPDNHFNLHNDTVVATVLIVERPAVGSEAIKSGLKAAVYPNPSNGVITVTVSSRSTVEVIDAKGVVTDRFTVDGSREIFLKGKGLYMLNIIDNSGRRVAKRALVK